MKRALLLPLAIAGSLAATHVPPLDIKEWEVPWERSRPRDPYVDRQERVWFVGQRSDYVAYLNPETGEFKRYELDPGTGPHTQIVDASGFVWYAGNRAQHIGRLDPEGGKIVKYPTPGARDPHSMAFDRAGDIWFTAQGGNKVGKLTVATGNVQILDVPTPNARPYGIAVDSKGRPWVALFNSNKLATVDPATMQLREIPLPRAEVRPRRLVVTSDDKIWYGDYRGGMLGRYDPETGKVDEWPLPGGPGSEPYAVTVDGADRVWLVETGSRPNRFVGFDTKQREWLDATVIPSGAGTVRNMVFDPRSQAIWFGTDANTIGRALVP
ncbi:MAG: virginiamycin B lyase family protein [Gemmatimonadales bacterium]